MNESQFRSPPQPIRKEQEMYKLLALAIAGVVFAPLIIWATYSQTGAIVLISISGGISTLSLLRRNRRHS